MSTRSDWNNSLEINIEIFSTDSIIGVRTAIALSYQDKLMVIAFLIHLSY